MFNFSRRDRESDSEDSYDFEQHSSRENLLPGTGILLVIAQHTNTPMLFRRPRIPLL